MAPLCCSLGHHGKPPEPRANTTTLRESIHALVLLCAGVATAKTSLRITKRLQSHLQVRIILFCKLAFCLAQLAPTCPRSLAGEVMLFKIDATQERGLASRFNVRGYPSVFQ